MQPEHLHPLLLQYLKSMQNETMEIIIHPKCQKFLASLDVSHEDLTTLNAEELAQFRKMVKENKQKSHRICSETMDIIYDFVMDILARKPLSGTSPIKIETVVSKVKLSTYPEEIIEEDWEEIVEEENDEGEVITIKVQHTANAAHSCLLYIKVG